MTYPAKLNRKAARLGITLPGDDDGVIVESAWSSVGEDTLFEGPCKLDRRNDGTWMVSLRRSGRQGGYRRVTEVSDLDQAMAVATFLGTRNGRRAFRGLAPKVTA